MNFVGTSAASRQLSREIETAARSDAKVLITGETGVGKDLVAHLIHEQSARRHARLAAINCAGMPDSLLESELFGHVRGSFTGAFRDKVGLLEAADRGTAFLDEAGEMSSRMQGMLLRFLETGEVQRVGSERALHRVNVRIIAATNRDLTRQIAAGAFREDLYYRLNVIRIHVPALRARADDVPVLFEHFAQQFSRQYGVPARRLTPEARATLMTYAWPGNVRELKNVVERLMVKGQSTDVEARDLPAECHASAHVLPFTPAARRVDPVVEAAAELVRRMVHHGESFWAVVHAPFMSRDLSREEVRAVIRAGLEQTKGNYRVLVALFNMAPDDYKRFLGFLRKHDCRIPFHAFRAVRTGGAAPAETSADYLEAAAM